MNEQENTDLYIKGFNQGYMIAAYEPELSEKLSKTTGESSFISGIQDGRQQYLDERFKEKMPSWLKNNPFEEKDSKSMTNEKDKDFDIEHER
ncbi:hypothetical protein ABID42_000527 [Arcicella rosea]|uniref:hypothetical protein n=1 Tax=Arcicella rosea TaxID=502909 RepID=UPI00345CC4D2